VSTQSILEVIEKLRPQTVSSSISKIIDGARTDLMARVTSANEALMVSYCCAVKDIDWRNQDQPYDKITLSRRIGEKWEPFCRVAWDHPSHRINRVQAPSITEIKNNHIARGVQLLGENARELLEQAWAFSDNINLAQDEVFMKDGQLLVVDFKSSYGSNEKGNRDRLMNVARAYKMYNSDTKLFLLVRDAGDNNYLRQLSEQWICHTGDRAYAAMSEMTGVDIASFCKETIDWPRDLSSQTISHFRERGLLPYLAW
jgi:hypothetical protein